MPELSVIIPVYNVEPYLRRCLDSVCNQSFKDIEIICINDCSTDGSGEILKEYVAKDSRICLLNNSINLNVGKSRNIGLKTASGKYICFMDSDDAIDLDYLEQLYDNAERHHADITINTTVWIEENNQRYQYFHPQLPPPITDEGCYMKSVECIENVHYTVWGRLFRRELLSLNHIMFDSIDYAEDLIFHHIACLYANTIFVFSGTSIYTYCRRTNSLSDVTEKGNMADYKIIQAYGYLYDKLAEHNLLNNNNSKLYHVHPFFQVNTPEKFQLYKNYFKKIKDSIEAHKDQYNELELFFSNIILTSESYDDYKTKYPASVIMAFLKNKKQKDS